MIDEVYILSTRSAEDGIQQSKTTVVKFKLRLTLTRNKGAHQGPVAPLKR
jgi:hypothetical protein